MAAPQYKLPAMAAIKTNFDMIHLPALMSISSK
jgi:hypothetical protein